MHLPAVLNVLIIIASCLSELLLFTLSDANLRKKLHISKFLAHNFSYGLKKYLHQKPFNLSELSTTLTLEQAIKALAHIGVI